MAQENRLSSGPLLPQSHAEVGAGVSMATADILPSPGQTQAPEAPRGQVPREFSLQGQESIGSATVQAKVNPVRLCIYTLKDGVYIKTQFESGRLTTAQQILSHVREALGMPEENEQVFGIWLTSKHLQLQLKSYHLPCKLFKRWKALLSQFTVATYEEISNDEPILSFQRNAFLPLKEERNLLKKQDPNDPGNCHKAIDYLYHEAVFHTTRGRYPLSVEEFHTQAGIQAAVKGLEAGSTPSDFKAEVNSYYPPHMHISRGGLKVPKLFKKSAETKTVADELVASYQEALKKCKDPHQLKVLYLQLCWHKPFYGSVFFKGIVEKSFKLLTTNEKHIVIAINTECVHLMSASAASNVLLYLTFDQLSWEFQAPDAEGEDYFSSLWLEFDSVLGADNKRVSKRIQIFSRQAPMMDAMISRCVDCINKQEEKFRQLRIQQGNKEFLDYNWTTTPSGSESPRIQKQELNYKEKKLQCTVLTPEGEAVGSRFTLTRALRRNSRKSKGDLPPTALSPGDETAPLAASTAEATEMTPITPSGGVAEPSDENASQTSDGSITTDV